MAKARFPGKPSKTSQITRLRICSRRASFSNDPSKIAAKQTASGLLLFQQTFGYDEDENGDFCGFEMIDGVFEARHSTKNKQQKEERIPHVIQNESTKHTQDAVPINDKSNEFSIAVITPNKSSISEFPVTGRPEASVRHSSIKDINICNKAIREYTPIHTSRNGSESSSESRLAKKLLDKAKSPKKFVLPSISAHSSRTIIPNKRFLEDVGATCEKYMEPHAEKQFRKQKFFEDKQVKKQEKERMKREIELYTDIMTTDIADCKQRSDECSSSPRPLEKNKEGKLREKIQQLLRSQWESRLQLVDCKTSVPLTRQDTFEDQGSVSNSSEDNQIFYKKRRIASKSNNASNAMKSKIILRKARLQLNQKLLKQLRQPSRLQQFRQQLVEQKSEDVAVPKSTSTPPTSSTTSILRPAQLVVQTNYPSARVKTSTITTDTSTLKEIPASVPLPSPALLKLNSLQAAGEIGVSNPLGCAFVMEPSDSKGLPGTVVCGVCGAVRRYSFILQARKFGTFSCEPCRKFISRILRARVPVKCASGTGRCIHPPVLRWNNACPPEDKPPGGEVVTSRCKACWLKLALTGFRMRESDHDDLRRLLPTDMRDLVPTATNRPEHLPWAPNRGQVIRMKNNSSNKVSVNPTGSTSTVVTAAEAVKQQELRIESQERSIDKTVNCSSNKTKTDCKAENSAGSRTRKKNEVDQTVASERSLLEIKGPRIKHVCRSAMLALGQPRAKFYSQELNDDYSSARHGGNCICYSTSESRSTVSDSSVYSPFESTSNCNSTTEIVNAERISPRSLDRKNFSGSPAKPTNIVQGERISPTYHDGHVKAHRIGIIASAAQAWQQQEQMKYSLKEAPKKQGNICCKSSQPKPKGLHSDKLRLNFWEPFDVDRVWEQGFAIIGSKLTSCPLCYLCGSGGRDELMLCSTCCDSFHSFCVADSSPRLSRKPYEMLCSHMASESSRTLNSKTMSNLNVPPECDDHQIHSSSTYPKDEECTPSNTMATTRLWTCRKCLVCQICNSNHGEKVVCSFCSLAYHWSCLGPPNLSWNNKKRTTWFCFNCSPLQDQVCPICRKPCNHGSRELRLQCSCCQLWIHSRCEKLSDEEYQLMSVMASLEYVCRLCDPEQIWMKSVQDRLKACYSAVVKEMVNRKLIETDRAILYFGNFDENLPTCIDFCKLVRTLTNLDGIVETLISKAMPWLKIDLTKSCCHPSTLTDSHSTRLLTQAKVIYDLESDTRLCLLCRGRGEGRASAEGRLLYCGNDEWIHVNCALWSNEVFEEIDGALQNVFDALSRSRFNRCALCNAKGATLSCCKRGCTVSFHFPCAQKDDRVTLLEDKTIYCVEHSNQEKLHSALSHCQTDFAVTRCVYVDLGAEMKRIKSLPSKDVSVSIGSLFISSLGQLQVEVSGHANYLVPVGYRCQRQYWSTKEPWRLTTYTFRTIFVAGTEDCNETDVNITVNHEDDDVIMAESGLNLAELETQDDRDLIHMVLEDANFEKELEGGSSTVTCTTTHSIIDSKDTELNSNGHHNSDGTSPSPSDDHALSLEAWLANPEHAVIFLDSTLLASLDMDSVSCSDPVADGDVPKSGNDVTQSSEVSGSAATEDSCLDSQRRLTYSKWKRMRMQPHKSSPKQPCKRRSPSSTRTTLDCNGNEAALTRVNSNNLVASIKVSSLSHTNRNSMESYWKRTSTTSSNILQLDGTFDSSETETERDLSIESIQPTSDNPVKCHRCRRSYRTWQSFNKHREICVEVLSSSDSNEDDSDMEPVIPVQPKCEPISQSDSTDCHHKKSDPIQVPIVNSSSSTPNESPCFSNVGLSEIMPASNSSKPVKQTVQRRRVKRILGGISRRPLAARLVNTIPLNSHLSAQTAHSTLRLTTPTHQLSPQVLYVANRSDINAYISSPSSQQSEPHQLFIASSVAGLPSVLTPVLSSPTFMQPTFSVPQVPQATAITVPTLIQPPTMLQYLSPVSSNSICTLGMVGMAHPDVLNSNFSFPTVVPGQIQIPWETVTNQLVFVQQPQLLLTSASTFLPIVQHSNTSLSPQRLPNSEPVTSVPVQPPVPTGTDLPMRASVDPGVSITIPEACGLCPADKPISLTNLDSENQLHRVSDTKESPSMVKKSQLAQFTSEENNIKPIKATFSYRSFMNSQRSKKPPAMTTSGNGKKNQLKRRNPPNTSLTLATQNSKLIDLSLSDTDPKIVEVEDVSAQEDPLQEENKGASKTVQNDKLVSEIEVTGTGVEKPAVGDSEKSEVSSSPTTASVSSQQPPTNPQSENQSCPSSLPSISLQRPSSTPPLAMPKSNSVPRPSLKERAPTPCTSPLIRKKTSLTQSVVGLPSSMKLSKNVTPSSSCVTEASTSTPGKENNDHNRSNKKFVRKQNKKAHILYELLSEDGYYGKSESLSDLWKQLLLAVKNARLACKLEPISSFELADSSRSIVGLHHNALRYILEQLPDAGNCSNYTFRYHTPQTDSEQDLIPSPYGCARSIPFSGRNHPDIFGWLASQHRPQPQPSSACMAADIDVTQTVGARRATSYELQPLAQRYRNLLLAGGQSVGVYRSKIHGRGLFTKRDIDAGEMVVEYAGEVIRSLVCDKREKEYESKGMGCYMFRVDDQTVVDATTHGNCARFINHSCEPNCYSRIVDILGKKHIIIFALRRILRGEELTYDYKFPIEDVKIPCTCGSRKCRKYLN